ncbi:hypothetical protein [Tsukamurella tyrosinosolvens]|uniref:hypothetical protein n=1 Tax=Tsukamurella tyrosinosolvens TaxID=57704 RepID=UPI000DF6CE02|nr:hypothetical protein [Tsukamurella tyrosinosolvens]RDB46208.1 hypothetical protein DVB87_19765 [Tsukamurella tyrosinosolvens]
MPTLPPETPAWLVLLVAVGFGLKYAAQFLSEASESVAKVFGPLGRRWRTRGEERARERAETVALRVSAITADRDFFEARAETLEADRRHMMDWYNRCDQPFHRALAIRAAEAGCELPEWEPLSRWPAPTPAGRE